MRMRAVCSVTRAPILIRRSRMVANSALASGLVCGIAALGVITLPVAIAFFILEVGLIATLQAFIFATLTSIYFGEATAAHH